MMLEKLKETNEVFNFIICPRPFSQNLVLSNFAGALTRDASVGRLEECFTGTALIRHLSAARCWRWPGVCSCVWPRQTLLKWAVIIIHRSPGHTQHIHYTNTPSSPLCSRQRSPPPPANIKHYQYPGFENYILCLPLPEIISDSISFSSSCSR